MIVEVLVRWMVNTTSSGSQVIEAWLPNQEVFPALRILGKALFAEPEKLKDAGGHAVLDGDMPQLIKAVIAKGELEVKMAFSTKYSSKLNNWGWANNRIAVSWVGHDGSTGSGSIGPFNYSVKHDFVTVPRWVFDDGKTTLDMVQGGLVAVFKNLVEDAHRRSVGEVQASLIDDYKKRSKKSKLTKKLVKELNAMEQVESGHNAMCTTCGMFNATKKSEGGDERIYSCSLGVFAEFNSIELTSDLYERNGVTQEGGKLRSIQGDARWSWNETKDEAMSFSQLLAVCRVVDRESCSWLGSVEENASMLEFIWDDILWIERFSKRRMLDSCTDLDELITEHRDRLVRKIQARYAKNYPAYADLFMQRAVGDVYQQQAVMDTTLEEVGEKAHVVPMNAFLNSYILSPCGLGFKSVKGKDGKYRQYLHRGYPMPERFGIEVVE